MTKISDALTHGLTIRESADDGSDFTNPAADYRRLFLGEDGQLHVKDSAGTVTAIGAASGSVATDTIWDAKGDLAGGTGANTAGRLAVGTNDHVLIAASGETTGLKWGQSAGTLLGITAYATGSDASSTAVTATSGTDIDATNLKVVFTAPASGNVLVRLSSLCTPDNNSPFSHACYWGLRESTSDIAGPFYLEAMAVSHSARYSMEFYLTGVSAGAHTYKWSGKVATSGSMGLLHGPTWGKAIMEVWACP